MAQGPKELGLAWLMLEGELEGAMVMPKAFI